MPPLSGTGPTVALVIVDSVPLAFGSAEETAPRWHEPALALNGETLDLLALPSIEVPLQV